MAFGTANNVDRVNATLLFKYDTTYTAIRGVPVQTFQSHFTVTGIADAFYPQHPNTPCPFPEFSTLLGSCSIPLTGSGIATSTIIEVPFMGAVDDFYLTSTTYAFTAVPEPATPILIAAGIGMLALLRKRLSGCRL